MQRDYIDNRSHIGLIEPVSFIHQTGDGPIHLLVKASQKGWECLHWGYRVSGAWTFDSIAEANEYVLRWFQKLYDGHRCSPQCRPVDAIDLHKADDPWGMIREQK